MFFLSFLNWFSIFLPMSVFFKFRLIFGISVGIIMNIPAWIVFLECGFSRVILTRSKNCEFKELLISRDLMEIELNRVHFRRLCFFELFWAEIWFFYLICFLKFRLIFGIFVGSIINTPAWIVFFGTRVYQGNFDDIQEWWI